MAIECGGNIIKQIFEKWIQNKNAPILELQIIVLFSFYDINLC